MMYGDALAADARLKILQLLRRAGEQPLNHEVVRLALETMSIRMTNEQVRNEFAWLAEMGTVTVMPVAHLTVASLTERGDDVARGLSVIAGITRHVPGSGR